MSDKPAKPVLLTGASGALGRTLTNSLSAAGWTLRLTDIAPFPQAIPAGASFTRADLNDGVALLRLAAGSAGSHRTAPIHSQGSLPGRSV
jgi:uronate dehydrogenase